MLTRILPGAGTGDNNWQGSFITGWPGNVIIAGAVPDADGKSFILHLRETEGKTAEISLSNGITGPKLRSEEVDVNGKALPDPLRSLRYGFHLRTFDFSPC